jgi:hypothetical protein
MSHHNDLTPYLVDNHETLDKAYEKMNRFVGEFNGFLSIYRINVGELNASGWTVEDLKTKKTLIQNLKFY